MKTLTPAEAIWLAQTVTAAAKNARMIAEEMQTSGSFTSSETDSQENRADIAESVSNKLLEIIDRA